ncbi:MAG: redox-regulated ATPase YchF [Alphaproteobacteria bacterium]
MGFNCGIVGLPNVGKSTLFNALTATVNAQAANYPFCTIEPNVGIIAVPDNRLDQLAGIVNPLKIVPTNIEFVDIAGLVRGASKGEGLGNKFLANIREVNAIVHVLRCFENSDITHVEGSIDPVRDAETVETELMIADLESMEKRIVPIDKKAKSGDKEAKKQFSVMEPVLAALREGKPARIAKPSKENKEDLKIFNMLQLLTAKPVLYACNVDENAAATGNDFSKKVFEMAAKQGNSAVVISAAIEAEVAVLTDKNEQKEFLETLGLEETGLAKVVKKGYELLDLITFFTAGPKEVRAWTLRKSSLAPQAAGVIHTDFEKGFIRSETISFDDYIQYHGEQGAKEAGKMRSEGKTYEVKDGDIVNFLFNV